MAPCSASRPWQARHRRIGDFRPRRHAGLRERFDLSSSGSAQFVDHPYADAYCPQCGLVCLELRRDAEGRAFEAVTAELLWERKTACEKSRVTALLEQDEFPSELEMFISPRIAEDI